MLWMLPFAGAAVGGLINKKDPLKGALMGGALGAGGMAAAPALGIGAGASGAAGAASAAAPMPVFDPTAGQWLQSSTAAVKGGEGLGLLETFDKVATPAAKGLGVASTAQGLLNPPEQPIQAQPLQSKPVDFGGLLSQRPQAMSDQDRYMQRIQAMMQGGYRG